MPGRSRRQWDPGTWVSGGANLPLRLMMWDTGKLEAWFCPTAALTENRGQGSDENVAGDCLVQSRCSVKGHTAVIKEGRALAGSSSSHTWWQVCAAIRPPGCSVTRRDEVLARCAAARPGDVRLSTGSHVPCDPTEVGHAEQQCWRETAEHGS